MTRRPWTVEDRQRLTALVAAGRPISAIVRELGRNSPGSVRFAMIRFGIEFRSNRWTDDEAEELAKLAAQGLTCKEIAALMPPRTTGAIMRKRRLMGLSNPDRRGRRQRRGPDIDLVDTDEL